MSRVLNIDSVRDGLSVSRPPWGVIACCVLLMGIDGYDLQVAAYAAPALIRAWAIDKAALATVFSAGQGGYLLGALLLSMAADRFGRQPVILWSIVLFSIPTLLAARAGSPGELVIYRLLAGMGLGGSVASVVALASESVPARRRAAAIAILFAGYTGGSALGGILAASLIPRVGWQSAFVVGGILPLIILPALIRYLPKSVRTAVRPRAVPAVDLFTDGRAVATCVLWAAFILSFLGHHLVTNWLPTLLDDMRVPLADAVLAGAALQAGGFVGCLATAVIVDLWGISSIALAFLFAAPAIGAIGLFGATPVLAIGLSFATGVFLIGGQIGLNTLPAALYSTDARATGTGWALGAGRVGAILGPVTGGALLSAGTPAPRLFFWAVVPALTCAATLILLKSVARKAARPGTVVADG